MRHMIRCWLNWLVLFQRVFWDRNGDFINFPMVMCRWLKQVPNSEWEKYPLQVTIHEVWITIGKAIFRVFFSSVLGYLLHLFFLSTIFITCVGLGRNFKYKTVSLIVYSLLQGICVLIWVWYILKNVKLTAKMYWITWNENCSPFFLGENKTPWFWYYRVWN